MFRVSSKDVELLYVLVQITASLDLMGAIILWWIRELGLWEDLKLFIEKCGTQEFVQRKMSFTCARKFDQLLNALVHLSLNGAQEALGNLLPYYFRIWNFNINPIAAPSPLSKTPTNNENEKERNDYQLVVNIKLTNKIKLLSAKTFLVCAFVNM